MQDDPRNMAEGHPADADETSSPLPDCRWYLKDPRSCMDPDSCGCYVDPCVYFGLTPDDCCVDADIPSGD